MPDEQPNKVTLEQVALATAAASPDTDGSGGVSSHRVAWLHTQRH